MTYKQRVALRERIVRSVTGGVPKPLAHTTCVVCRQPRVCTAGLYACGCK